MRAWRIQSLLAVFTTVAMATSGCTRSSSDAPQDGVSADAPRIAFITNGVADFWKIGQAGAEAAGREFDARVTVIMPSGMTDQKRKLEDVLIRGTRGVAISPINPDDQTGMINEACAKTHVITHDSDAPNSDRLAYVGMDNYKAGLMCGQLVREAIPDGGKVMIFIGRMEQDNSRRRRQGTIDAILGREPDSSRNDPPGDVLTSEDGKYQVLGTLTDQFDRAKAKANAADALSRTPDIACMVGLFEYNPPLILEALDRKGALGKVKVVGFDENEVTLQGIKDGVIHGTVVQNPYSYGYESVRILAGLAHDKTLEELGVPESGFLEMPARVIKADNVEEFWADLNEKLGRGA